MNHPNTDQPKQASEILSLEQAEKHIALIGHLIRSDQETEAYRLVLNSGHQTVLYTLPEWTCLLQYSGGLQLLESADFDPDQFQDRLVTGLQVHTPELLEVAL